jgi:hypothetical protein
LVTFIALKNRPLPIPENMLSQSPLTVLAPIAQGKLDSLKILLQEINKDIEANARIPFKKLSTIHFARFVIIDAIDSQSSAWLAFSTNYDGDLEAHLNEMYSTAGDGFNAVYSHCEGYNPCNQSEFKKYLKSKMLPFPKAFYAGHRGLSVEAIHLQNKIRDAIEGFLNNSTQSNNNPIHVRKNIVEHFKVHHADLLKQPPAISLKTAWQLIAISILIVVGIGFAIGTLLSWKILGMITLILLGAIGVFYIALRIKEKSDDQIEVQPDASLVSRISDLTKQEDFTTQNQLTHLVEIKPGWFRLMTLNFVLWAINLLAIYKYNKGKLGNIPTIHFARWVIIDKGKRLLFFSNFDGSWESYLGDFVDKAAVGLTGVWSNTKLFPTTKNLIQLGATDEERFKYWTRIHQIPTQVWYTAYKTLSVVNVLNNNAIHQGLFKENMSAEECQDWLRKL